MRRPKAAHVRLALAAHSLPREPVLQSGQPAGFAGIATTDGISMRTNLRIAPCTVLAATLTCFTAANLSAAPQAPETPLNGAPAAEIPPGLPDTIDPRDYVVVSAVGHYGRLAVQ